MGGAIKGTGKNDLHLAKRTDDTPQILTLKGPETERTFGRPLLTILDQKHQPTVQRSGSLCRV